ncbi:G-protein alpha subunit-domain-containing protein [Mycena galericulata]|nr:G-protein alpha subunit-domain-containing protein [Mycena galericulata]
MLCCNILEILRQRRQQRTATSRSEEINSILRQERQNYRGRGKSVLVLGGPSSGKATFLKQARLFGSGFSDTEREEYKSDIRKSVIKTVKMALDKIPPTTQSSSLDQIILSFRRQAETSATITPDTWGVLSSLWEDESTRTAILTSFGPRSRGSFPYFMDSIDRIADPSYTLTDADILRVVINHIPTVRPYADSPKFYPILITKFLLRYSLVHFTCRIL